MDNVEHVDEIVGDILVSKFSSKILVKNEIGLDQIRIWIYFGLGLCAVVVAAAAATGDLVEYCCDFVI